MPSMASGKLCRPRLAREATCDQASCQLAYVAGSDLIQRAVVPRLVAPWYVSQLPRVFISINQTLTIDVRGRECAAGSQQADG